MQQETGTLLEKLKVPLHRIWGQKISSNNDTCNISSQWCVPLAYSQNDGNCLPKQNWWNEKNTDKYALHSHKMFSCASYWNLGLVEGNVLQICEYVCICQSIFLMTLPCYSNYLTQPHKTIRLYDLYLHIGTLEFFIKQHYSVDLVHALFLHMQ